MTKILITGANSYIGTSFEEYMKSFGDKYQVDTVDMIDGSWRDMDMSGYDALFHVAGLAHQKETAENSEMYYKVNRDLAIDVATKAKSEGVGQFVFLSTMSVYGINSGIITKDTLPEPKSNYGKSKLQAEDAIKSLSDDRFAVTVLRPPMVYGKGCRGNFQSVVKIVEKSPIFPKINNNRSMIYIKNLCSFVEMCIDKNLTGVFFPQNKEYVRTDRLASLVARKKGKGIYLSVFCGIAVRVMKPIVTAVEKAFGTLIYKDTEEFDFGYCITDFETSVEESV